MVIVSRTLCFYLFEIDKEKRKDGVKNRQSNFFYNLF